MYLRVEEGKGSQEREVGGFHTAASEPVSVCAGLLAGSDANSMDSENCWERRKTDDLQNTQAGSNPKKVDLIIWEIEVPKVRRCPGGPTGLVGWGAGTRRSVDQKGPKRG